MLRSHFGSHRARLNCHLSLGLAAKWRKVKGWRRRSGKASATSGLFTCRLGIGAVPVCRGGQAWRALSLARIRSRPALDDDAKLTSVGDEIKFSPLAHVTSHPSLCNLEHLQGGARLAERACEFIAAVSHSVSRPIKSGNKSFPARHLYTCLPDNCLRIGSFSWAQLLSRALAQHLCQAWSAKLGRKSTRVTHFICKSHAN